MAENQSWNVKFQEAFRDIQALSDYLGWKIPEDVAKKYPLFIPRNLASRIKKDGPSGVLAREFLPHQDELSDLGFADPIGDKTHQAAPQLIHRYKNRALFTATSVCPVHCRYCFRKNELSPNDEIFGQDFEKTLTYLGEHSEISEIIFTGGDPLTLSDVKLDRYFEAFAKIPHIKDIRIHTRYPVILPERIDEEFCELMVKWKRYFRTVSMAIHANHLEEISCQSRSAIKLLGATGIQLLSQTVLLRGVNDRPDTLLALIEFFIDHRIRPYYLHHPDQVKGGMHFYLPLEEGRRIYSELRDKLPGWAIPQYVIDIPGGHGKVGAFNPESYTYSGQLIGANGQTHTISELVD